MHENDPNFPGPVLDRMATFLTEPDVLDRPEKHSELVREMKLEALLATEDSPYVEVRANVDPTDDPSMPSFTFRVWVIGCVAACCGSFIDTLFGYRNPPISVGANVAQLIAYPVGKFLARVLPRGKITIFGREFTMNNGPFNKKEHMLITIMASVSFGAPYTNYIVPAQAMPMFFNESWAFSHGYQVLNTIGTNFVGYGLAGLARRFLVYPSVAIWPSTLNTVSLIKAFHTDTNEPVKGPFGWTFRASREKCFLLMFAAMFFYYFFPGFIFGAMSIFSWMTWIAPNNAKLAAVTGFQSGMGLNPWPTFDFNNLTIWISPLTIPTFSIINMFFGILIGAIMVLACYYSNAWNTGYIPINSNAAWSNTAERYNVSKILDSKHQFQDELFQDYSQPWMSAGFVISYLWYFALYSATITWVLLYHRHDIVAAFRSFKNSVRKLMKKPLEDNEDDLSEDIHYRLMQVYPEVHEWEYAIVLVISLVLGMVGLAIYPTNTSPVVVIFGIIFTLIVLIPSGMIQASQQFSYRAVTGIPVPLNVIAEFIGGSMVAGNANALMYFKTYGYITASQALSFSGDLKLAHYLKIPPRHTFYAQLIATFIYCIVSSSIFNFAMGFKGACTPEADFRFTCPNQRTFFTAAVFWGTISPKRLFGPGRRYNLMLLGFPLGVVLVLVHWALRKKWPRSELLRQIHPVMITAGPSTWGSPYNMSYYIGNVYLVLISFQWLRKRYLSFWVKYNYVVAAAWPCGIAISAIVIFFALEIPDNGTLGVNWWGNNVVGEGCDGLGPNGVECVRLQTLPDVGYFGPPKGTFT
ncbi:OPT oligopeptide transporter protein-domain-containing protein [Kockovaella imperatae]|uniref:OPT oligopeptide transporter protein-domain-containing protein n=1 Tax=Kockovaella imperatae TaxID=4999 RepID=A0A1Y1UHQ4_9TREE|nr:OPT oligopeptide transporter protein-domain-containing protein [Kockovaella imperatae]ORX37519.1 OPT oligopeptide transporter protein-domain-containing protein [Kockovaella imperatae]